MSIPPSAFSLQRHGVRDLAQVLVCEQVPFAPPGVCPSQIEQSQSLQTGVEPMGRGACSGSEAPPRVVPPKRRHNIGSARGEIARLVLVVMAGGGNGAACLSAEGDSPAGRLRPILLSARGVRSRRFRQEHAEAVQVEGLLPLADRSGPHDFAASGNDFRESPTQRPRWRRRKPVRVDKSRFR